MEGIGEIHDAGFKNGFTTDYETTTGVVCVVECVPNLEIMGAGGV